MNKKSRIAFSRQPGYLLLPRGDPWLSVPALRLVWLYLGFHNKQAFPQISINILQFVRADAKKPLFPMLF